MTDVHAGGSVKVELELTDDAPLFYARYMLLIEAVLSAEGAEVGNRWSARDMDLALWILGGK